MSIFKTFRVSFSTGTSVNTGFSMVGTNNVDFFAYNMSVWNVTPSDVGICISPSAPTATTTDQIYVPGNATTAKDTRQSKYFLSSGHNVYVRTPATSVVSGTLTIEFW